MSSMRRCAGLPVLLSDQTPWGEVVEQGVGRVFSLDNGNGTAFARTINVVVSWVSLSGLPACAHAPLNFPGKRR